MRTPSRLRYRGPSVAPKYCESTMHPVYHAKITVSTKNFLRSEGRKCSVKGLDQWRGLMVWSRSWFRWSSPHQTASSRSAIADSNWKPACIFLAAIFCQGRKVDLVSTSPISPSILSKSWVCLSQDFLGTLKSFVAYLISRVFVESSG